MSTLETQRVPVAARAVVLVAALFAIICVLAVGRRNSSDLLIALFVLWVFAPFALLALLIRASVGWNRGKQLRLQGLSLSVCAVSVCVYGVVAFGMAGSKPAFWFLVLPFASLCVTAIAYPVALKERG